VDVIELPRDPALYTQALHAGGYFETVTLSETDASRTQQYADNAKRQSALEAFSSIDDFLASLQMTVAISPLQDDDLPRFCQLINKTNQFNLTTHRYSEADIHRLRSDNAAECFQVRLADKFGDTGLISAVILLPKDAGLQIDTWLMSCRVLGRRVEDAVMQFLISHCAHRGGRQLEGLYIPTGKNGMVSDLYEKHGFSREEDNNDVHRWTIAVSDYKARELPFSVLTPYPQRLMAQKNR
jgi:FkbH-like protein